eukprot:SAG22_NODE_480_length_9955_cov_3.601258_5_plen_1313_part_00
MPTQVSDASHNIVAGGAAVFTNNPLGQRANTGKSDKEMAEMANEYLQVIEDTKAEGQKQLEAAKKEGQKQLDSAKQEGLQQVAVLRIQCAFQLMLLRRRLAEAEAGWDAAEQLSFAEAATGADLSKQLSVALCDLVLLEEKVAAFALAGPVNSSESAAGDDKSIGEAKAQDQGQGKGGIEGKGKAPAESLSAGAKLFGAATAVAPPAVATASVQTPAHFDAPVSSGECGSRCRAREAKLQQLYTKVCTENTTLRRQHQAALERLSELESEHTRLLEATVSRKAGGSSRMHHEARRRGRRGPDAREPRGPARETASLSSVEPSRQRGRQHTEQGQSMAIREWIERSLGRELTADESTSVSDWLAAGHKPAHCLSRLRPPDRPVKPNLDPARRPSPAMREVGRWLVGAGLSEYGPRFEAEGYDELDTLWELAGSPSDVDDLVADLRMPRGHEKKLKLALTALRSNGPVASQAASPSNRRSKPLAMANATPMQRAKARAGWRWASMPGEARAQAIQNEIDGTAEAVEAAASPPAAMRPRRRHAGPPAKQAAAAVAAEEQMRRMQKQMKAMQQQIARMSADGGGALPPHGLSAAATAGAVNTEQQRRRAKAAADAKKAQERAEAELARTEAAIAARTAELKSKADAVAAAKQKVVVAQAPAPAPIPKKGSNKDTKSLAPQPVPPGALQQHDFVPVGADGGGPRQYRALKAMAIRRGLEKTTEKLGTLPVGSVIDVIGTQMNAEGQIRIAFDQGWITRTDGVEAVEAVKQGEDGSSDEDNYESTVEPEPELEPKQVPVLVPEPEPEPEPVPELEPEPELRPEPEPEPEPVPVPELEPEPELQPEPEPEPEPELDQSTGPPSPPPPPPPAPPAPPPTPAPTVWNQHTDPSCDKPYWHNPETGETTWDDPEQQTTESQGAEDLVADQDEDGMESDVPTDVSGLAELDALNIGPPPEEEESEPEPEPEPEPTDADDDGAGVIGSKLPNSVDSQASSASLRRFDSVDSQEGAEAAMLAIGNLTVSVAEARRLPEHDGELPSPYALIKLSEQTRKRRTATVPKAAAPKWPASDSHTLQVSAASQVLLVTLHDDQNSSSRRVDAALGRVELPVQAVLDAGTVGWLGWLPLAPMAGIRQDVQGEVRLMVSFAPTSDDDLSVNPLAAVLSPESQLRPLSVAAASESEVEIVAGPRSETEADDSDTGGKPRRRRFSLTKMVDVRGAIESSGKKKKKKEQGAASLIAASAMAGVAYHSVGQRHIIRPGVGKTVLMNIGSQSVNVFQSAKDMTVSKQALQTRIKLGTCRLFSRNLGAFPCSASPLFVS